MISQFSYLRRYSLILPCTLPTWRCCILLLVLLYPALKIQANELIYFDISSSSANQALINFAEQSQQTLIFSFELTKDTHSQAIQGYYTADFALKKLLRDSGLDFKKHQDGGYAIFAKKLPDKSQAKLAKKTLQANAEIEPSIEKIAIVGSRTASHSTIDLPVPVDILTFEQLARSGQSTVGDALQTLVPSFNVSTSAISDGSDVLQPATLRGLAPDQTLVLINGKRRHQASLIHINNTVGRGTAGSDLNAIPLLAIKRIEVLRDGAAAQYGSDAIAGVINIVLNDDTVSDYGEVYYGRYTKGDGTQRQAKLTKTFHLANHGFINTAISVIDQDATNRAGLDGQCLYQGCTTLTPGQYQTENSHEINANRRTFVIGKPKTQQQALVINGKYAFSHGDLYGFANYSQRDNRSATFFRTSHHQSTNPLLADGEPVLTHGYLPKIDSRITDSALNIGYAFTLANGTDIDSSYTHGVNSISYRTQDSLNASYANFLHNQQILTPAQIRASIPRSAHAYDLSLSLQTLNLDLSHDFTKISIAAGIELRRDQYRITPGEQYSYFDYDQQPVRLLYSQDGTAGIQGFPGIAPASAVNEQRDVQSGYFEVTQQTNEHLTLSSAVRLDHYDDFGTATTFKVATNWRLNKSLAFRAAYNTGFRAPAMQQLYFNNTSTQFIVTEEQELLGHKVATFRNDSTIAARLGIAQLKEETSKNLSLGAVAHLSDSFNISLDYYQIHINDRIVLSSGLTASDNALIAKMLATEQVDSAQVFLNGIDSKTQGIDLLSQWRYPLYDGTFALTLAANLTDTNVSRVFTPKASALGKLPQSQVFSMHDIAIIESWQPRSRINLNLDYQSQDWRLNIQLNRFGQYTVIDGKQQTYSAKLITDIRAEYQVAQHMRIFIGSNNLLDVYPDKNTIGNARQGSIFDSAGNTIVNSDGVFVYSRRSAPFGYSGRFVYAGIRFEFP
ncbi:iron complex outermembrane recepter protein [Colwellia chukchiensis]|uniref:Iron complex outermembrane recepter protein n=1 Tax=Colwellia chukchiensis TaxID=641665 RepID=A0A1H7IW16_9GAMM|nr:TonB-dependent receptor [Colwellia chukchiensis]SEK66691.1 iron complex outermembrane recepter protein [Colwellia chukchiensis]